jgi:hypothetical protein
VARWTRREVLTRRVEFLVPLGDPVAEIETALMRALAEWRNVNPGSEAPGDYARVTADDEFIIISVEVREGARKTDGHYYGSCGEGCPNIKP